MPDREQLETRQLKAFVAVAEELSVTRAARRLHISQPPLTRQIRQIESVVGAPLFLRTPRGLQLTNAGSVLLADARNLLDSGHHALERARSAALGHVGRIDVAGFGSLMLGAVAEFLAHFRTAHPGVELRLHTLNRPEQVEALRQHRITVGFLRDGNDPEEIGSQLFLREEMVAALASEDPLARRRRLSLRDLVKRPLIVQGSGPRPNFTDTLIAMYTRAGLRPVIAQTVGDSVTAVAVVAGGFGTALVPRSTSQLKLPGVCYVPVTDATPAPIVCVYRKADRSAVVQLFLDELRAFRKHNGFTAKSAA